MEWFLGMYRISRLDFDPPRAASEGSVEILTRTEGEVMLDPVEQL